LKIEKDNFCPVEVKEYDFIYIDDQINTAFPTTLANLSCEDLNIEEGLYSFKCKNKNINAEVMIIEDDEVIGQGISTVVAEEFDELMASLDLQIEQQQEGISRVGLGKREFGDNDQQRDFIWAHYQFEFDKETAVYHAEIFVTGLGAKILRVEISYFTADSENRSEELQLFMEQLNQHLGSLD